MKALIILTLLLGTFTVSASVDDTLLTTSQLDLENNGQMLVDNKDGTFDYYERNINDVNSNFELIDSGITKVEIENY